MDARGELYAAAFSLAMAPETEPEVRARAAAVVDELGLGFPRQDKRGRIGPSLFGDLIADAIFERMHGRDGE